MPQYMLSVNQFEGEPMPSGDELQAIFVAVEAFNDEVRNAGAWVYANGLQPIETTTTVDNTGDAPIVTDGPFAESKEWLGGFWIIEVANLDEALEWAKGGSKACAGKVEVRPFQEMPEA